MDKKQVSYINKIGSGDGKMLLVRIVKNNKIDDYFKGQVRVRKC